MLSIVSTSKSPRLEYVCEFIFAQQFGLPYEIVNEKNREQVIFYGMEDSSYLTVPSAGLLFEEDIKPQDLGIENMNDQLFLFARKGYSIGFDIFSAIFYLITRYEEYLPHEKDRYGRYAHKESVAYQKGFLAKPIVDEWLEVFKALLLQRSPGLVFKERQTSFTPTYDIDIAYSFLGKGWLRNIARFLKSPSWHPIKVWLGKEKDPYDSYDFLDGLHEKYGLQPIYFFLLAPKLGKFDKNINVNSSYLKNLIQRLSVNYELGVHPSWQSFLNSELIEQQKDLLSELSRKKVTKSRQHYVKMILPESYRKLIDAGIEADYTMGYGSTNGFRASTANSFYWFDLQNNMPTPLVIHPFCFMDATSIFIDKKDATSALEELQNLYAVCKKYGSPCITIFHNNLLGSSKEGKGYREMYETFLRSL